MPPPPPRQEEEESESGGTVEKPKSSFTTYVAEGDKLYKKAEYRKAIDSYSTAIEIADNENADKKNCFVSRALCHLQMGDSEAALSDAEEALELDQEYIKGLWVKAEALYRMGDFEYALMFYHRGHNARSDYAEFKIGIQKAQEAIENAIGKEDAEELNAEGDLTMFYNRDTTQNYITFSEKRNKEKKQGNKGREEKKKDNKDNKSKPGGKASKKSSRRLLGEIYSDKEYLEMLFKDDVIANEDTDSGKKIKEYTSDALDYLGKREDFWRQQNPSSVHDKKQERTGSGRVITTAQQRRNDPGKYLIKQIEKVEEDIDKKKYKQAEKKSKDLISETNTYNENELPNKQEFLATLHSLYGTSLLEQEKYEQAEKEYQKDYDISEEENNFDGKSRALDNLGRICVKQEKFSKAIEYWETKVQLLNNKPPPTAASSASKKSSPSEDALERTWLYHEIGRCHLEEGNFSESKEYGEKALESAKIPDDVIWQLNAMVLIAKSEVKMEEYQSASESFGQALDLARAQGAKEAEKAIERALKDVNDNIVKGMKADENEAEAEEGGRSGDEGGEQQQQEKKK